MQKMDLLFQILVTLVAIEHIYIMLLETVFTKSAVTARTFKMDRSELERHSVVTLFKNQGIYNLLLAVLILVSVWILGDFLWTHILLVYIFLVALYGGITSNPAIIIKQGGLPLVALIYSLCS